MKVKLRLKILHFLFKCKTVNTWLKMGNLNCFSRCFGSESEVTEGLIVNGSESEFDDEPDSVEEPEDYIEPDQNNNEPNINAVIDALFHFLHEQNQNIDNLERD